MTRDFIRDFIEEKKIIQNRTRPKRQEKNRSYRMTVDLVSEDGRRRYTMFIRQLVVFSENFTVGLSIETPNPYFSVSQPLLRFQGPHGGQSILKDATDLHNDYHKHIYTEEDYNNNRYKPGYKEASLDFSSLDEAIVAFLEYCNIDDPCGIFDKEKESISQIKMDFNI